jgi:hypothetical protein
VTVLIDKIETEIRNAAVCFAEITQDNPNVWYELGFAISANKPVVMVCSEERTKFPFDVSHRRIIRYSPRSPSQFQKLKKEITQALRSIERSEKAIQRIEEVTSAGLFFLAARNNQTVEQYCMDAIRCSMMLTSRCLWSNENRKENSAHRPHWKRWGFFVFWQ